jgi:8-oxo-dGTP pyrophosphatase MutT (NUDIX family)
MARALTAAGFILARVTPDGPRYLLLKNARHGDWGFAKGHAETGETELETALRETREETGIAAIEVLKGAEFRSEYNVHGGKRGDYLKRVVYFVGRVNSESLTRSDEHSQAEWADLESALGRLRHASLQRALRGAHALLTSQAIAGP